MIGARILIVEDNRDSQESLGAILKSLGHLPVVANDGNEALRMLETNNVDLVITDVVMPGMNGLVFARRARETRPATFILFVTGDADALDEVLASGSVALLKPYSSDKLRSVIDEALSDSRS